MIAVADLVWIIIAAGIVLAVLLGGLAVLARRGRRVHVAIDVDPPPDDAEQLEP